MKKLSTQTLKKLLLNIVAWGLMVSAPLILASTSSRIEIASDYDYFNINGLALYCEDNVLFIKGADGKYQSFYLTDFNGDIIQFKAVNKTQVLGQDYFAITANNTGNNDKLLLVDTLGQVTYLTASGQIKGISEISDSSEIMPLYVVSDFSLKSIFEQQGSYVSVGTILSEGVAVYHGLSTSQTTAVDSYTQANLTLGDIKESFELEKAITLTGGFTLAAGIYVLTSNDDLYYFSKADLMAQIIAPTLALPKENIQTLFNLDASKTIVEMEYDGVDNLVVIQLNSNNRASNNQYLSTQYTISTGTLTSEVIQSTLSTSITFSDNFPTTLDYKEGDSVSLDLSAYASDYTSISADLPAHLTLNNSVILGALSIYGTYKARFIFIDVNGNRAFKSILFSITRKPNILPTANAGDSQTITELETLTLTGTANDSDGTIEKVQWTKQGEASVLTSELSFTQTGLSIGEHTFTLTVTDDRDDEATASTTVMVTDATAPVITLKGSASLNQFTGETYTEQGATATDNYDSSVDVVITGSVDITQAGTYSLSYTSTDKAGNSSAKTRTITLIDPDTTPENFDIANLTNQSLNEVVTTNTITVTGINKAVTASTTLGTLVVNSTDTGNTSAEVSENDTLAISLTTSSDYSTTQYGEIRVGLTSDSFTITTESAPALVISSPTIAFAGPSFPIMDYMTMDLPAPVVSGVTAGAVYAFTSNPFGGKLTINADTGVMTWNGDSGSDDTIGIKVTNTDGGTSSTTIGLHFAFYSGD